MIKTGIKVIVNVEGVYKIGIIIKTYNRLKGKLYNILMESGSVFSQIPMDNQKSMIFIDSKRTKSLIHKINTNIDNSYEVFRRNVTTKSVK